MPAAELEREELCRRWREAFVRAAAAAFDEEVRRRRARPRLVLLPSEPDPGEGPIERT